MTRTSETIPVLSQYSSCQTCSKLATTGKTHVFMWIYMKTCTGGAVPIMNQYDTCKLVQKWFLVCWLWMYFFHMFSIRFAFETKFNLKNYNYIGLGDLSNLFGGVTSVRLLSPFVAPMLIMVNLWIFYSIRFFSGFIITWGHWWNPVGLSLRQPWGIYFTCRLVRPLSKNLFYSILSKVCMIMSQILCLCLCFHGEWLR